MKISKTFNDKLIVKQLESDNLSMGVIETNQKKSLVKVEILGISEKSETGLKVGDTAYILTDMVKIPVSTEDESIYMITEKALGYME
jgi:hypothetical protein